MAPHSRADKIPIITDVDENAPLTAADRREATTLLVQRKMHLVNEELDRLGFGRYQLCIFFLCGMGYFLDLMWALLFGLVLPPLQRELGIPDAQIGDLGTCFSAGLTLGAFFWGVAVDIIGRRWAFNLTCLFASAFGFPSNYYALLALAFLTGIGVGGNISIDATITLEFLPKKNRYLLVALSIFQPLGVVVCSGMAFGLIPPFSCDQTLKSCLLTSAPCCEPSTNRGWRYLTFAVGGLTFLTFVVRFLIFSFQESPKFLLTRGKDDRALAAVEYIAKFNRQTCNLRITDFTELDEAASHHRYIDKEVVPNGICSRFTHVFGHALKSHGHHLKGLFKTWRSARITLTVWLIYITDFWGFTMAGFLPLILSNLGIKNDVSIYHTYLNYIIINTCGIPGVLIATGIIEIKFLGRKWSMLIASMFMSASCFLFVFVDGPIERVGFNAMEYFFQSMFNAILYGWTPEVFPAQLRGSASGFASTLGRITGFVAPQIAGHLLANDPTGKMVLYLAGGGVAISSLAILSLPNDLETRGKEVY
eukprot:TRINITY_DN3249_c0_g1_i3.p1 TRINITY_DN3249_c0_g1~~TRINITY_DN3249_c0_g1_i3.p1  ORF type:complete len:535 (+),score=118.58 TRINITY_DN3249_c0_g1_i3:112-1716(+)